MSISTTVDTPATVDTPGRIVSRYLAWRLWAVALCGVIFGCMSYTWANDNLRNKNYVSKGGVNAPTSFPTATDTRPPEAQVAPPNGSNITKITQIIVKFSESMDTTSLALGGDMAAESDSGVWSISKHKDDTLTIGPKTQWNAGNQRTLTIGATDIAKNPLATLNLTFMVTSKGTLGTLKWRFKAGYYVSSSPAIGADGTIYVDSVDGYFYALNPDGTLKWRLKTGDGVWSSPAIGVDGTVYIGSLDNNLCAIHGDTSLATSLPWPKFHHDNQNTGRISTGK